MTCGMLYVMRRERRGVLHLDKYSPPKKLVGWGREEKKEKKKEKKEERQREGKRTSNSLINK